MSKPLKKANAATPNKDTSLAQWQPRPAVGVSIARGLSFDRVGYEIEGRKVLNEISIDVEPGEVLCLLGPSGSGKTSLLRIAAGLIETCTGRVSIDALEATGPSSFVPPEKRGIGLVFQDYALFPHLTLLKNVEFGLRDFSPGDARLHARKMLSRVGMADREDNYPHMLSGGEQQRVALARALAPRPGILLMDEPFSGLDARLRDSIRDQTLELLRETRSTAVIVTHDAEEALRVGDRIALIRDGRLVQHGKGGDLYRHPKDLFTAAFFSEINKIPAEVSNGYASTVFGRVPTDVAKTGRALAVVRHTDINVKPFLEKGIGTTADIVDRRFLGRTELIELAISGLDEPIYARLKPDEVSRDAKSVLVSAEPNSVMIFSSTEN